MPEIAGAVLSILTVVDADVAIPAPFVAVQLRVVPDVSEESTVVSQCEEDEMPDSESTTSHCTCTSLVYQPFAPSTPFTCGVITGPVVSRAIVKSEASVSLLTGMLSRNS